MEGLLSTEPTPSSLKTLERLYFWAVVCNNGLTLNILWTQEMFKSSHLSLGRKHIWNKSVTYLDHIWHFFLAKKEEKKERFFFKILGFLDILTIFDNFSICPKYENTCKAFNLSEIQLDLSPKLLDLSKYDWICH